MAAGKFSSVPHSHQNTSEVPFPSKVQATFPASTIKHTYTVFPRISARAPIKNFGQKGGGGGGGGLLKRGRLMEGGA